MEFSPRSISLPETSPQIISPRKIFAAINFAAGNFATGNSAELSFSARNFTVGNFAAWNSRCVKFQRWYFRRVQFRHFKFRYRNFRLMRFSPQFFLAALNFAARIFFPFKNTFSYNFVGLTSDRSSPQKVSPQDCFAAEIFVIFLIFDLLISLASLLTFQSRLTSQKKRWQNLSRRNFPRLKKKSCSETFRDETSRGKAVSWWNSRAARFPATKLPAAKFPSVKFPVTYI